MKHPMLVFLLTITLAPPCSAFSSDLVFPWVTNNPSFRATVVINNLNAQSVDITLTATRAAGSSPESETVMVNLGPFAQLVSVAGDLFLGMGEGSAYMVRLLSDADNITGGFVVTGTQSTSGSSPSQANVFNASEASGIILYNYLSVGGGGFSAPVVINMGDSDADVTFYAFQNGIEVGRTVRNVASLHPLADIVSNLFGDIQGDLYLVAESSQPLLGVAFIFNSLLEPSMANAVPLGGVPDPGAGNGGPTVSFATDIQPIFNATCGDGDCHLMGSVSGGLALDEGAAYANIVNVLASPVFLNLNLIEPGDPDNSYLFRKLLPPDQAEYFPDRMPKNRSPLIEAEIELFRTWILEGAIDN